MTTTTDTVTTTLHVYNFDTAITGEKQRYEALRDKLKAQGLKCFETWGGKEGHYYPFREMEGDTLTLEPPYFDNQWNTGPTSNSEKGWRVFDWAQDYMIQGNRAIKRGHYLEQTPAMKEVRRNTVACGYCGTQEPAQKGDVFCPHCLDSEYLKEAELHLTRMQSIDTRTDRAPLTEAERAHLLPLYRDAQLHGSTDRGRARLTKARRDIEETYQRETANAKTERDGLIWLLDHGVALSNVIFYSHTQRFGFGWRQPVEPSVKSGLLDILCEFPFDYDIK